MFGTRYNIYYIKVEVDSHTDLVVKVPGSSRVRVNPPLL